MRVSFIVPAFNEAGTIAEVLARIDRLGIDRQIVVVDDGSTDDTPRILEEWAKRDGVIVIRQENRGKGAAIRAAIPHLDGEIAVVQDADMEYDPADVPQLIEPILRGAADVVYGSRLSGGKPQRAYMFWHLGGNRFLSLVTNHLFHPTLSAIATGYKAFRVEVLRSPDLREDSFSTIEPEITGQICKQKSCGSTRCRSRTTAAATRRARRSRGVTASRRCGRSSACDSMCQGNHDADGGDVATGAPGGHVSRPRRG